VSFLDYDRLEAVDIPGFRSRRPYPWLNAERLLSDEGFDSLVASLPDTSRFVPFFGMLRAHGQPSHDRYALEYDDGLNVVPIWHAFVNELRGERYGRFLRRAFGRGMLRLSFHWHYTPNGCSVSPHCDAKRKLGSHIFYFNTPQEWDASWGGQTVILDDGGRFDHRSAPRFEDFTVANQSVAVGNYSLLFARRDKSWHGVREIHCPEGKFRKVFIVVIEDWARSVQHRAIDWLRGSSRAAY
jgi:hypothetical protein